MRIPKFFDQYFDMLGFAPNLRAFLMTELMAPHRHYHGTGHHALMLRQVQSRPCNKKELLAATFFHDIVYDAQRSDNEEMSAATARLWLKQQSGLDIELIIDAILATKTHKLAATSGARESTIQWFLRADLMILWTNQPTVYEWYARGVRREYAHVPNDLYRTGRANVLENLRGTIHPYVRAQASMQMSRNIDWELACLQQGKLDV